MIETTILITSAALNIFFVFYLRWLLKNFTFLSENTRNLFETAENFSNHLKAVYELETFYGDETLKVLLDHAISFNNQLDTFEYIYSLTEKESELNDKTDPEKEEEQEER